MTALEYTTELDRECDCGYCNDDRARHECRICIGKVFAAAMQDAAENMKERCAKICRNAALHYRAKAAESEFERRAENNHTANSIEELAMLVRALAPADKEQS